MKMRFLRWSLLTPGAMLAGVAGSLAGGMIASVFGQGAADTASAFVGTAAFVFAACAISPSHRERVGRIAVALIALLAIGTVILSTFTTIDEFARLLLPERFITPVAQCLGASYALFIGLPLMTPGMTLERLHREILALACGIVLLGLLLAVLGTGAALAGFGWLGTSVGIGVALLGGITWAFPFFHMTFRIAKAKSAIEEQFRDVATEQRHVR